LFWVNGVSMALSVSVDASEWRAFTPFHAVRFVASRFAVP